MPVRGDHVAIVRDLTGVDRRDSDDEFAAAPDAITDRGDRAAVHFDDASYERQTDAKAPTCPASGAVGLPEHLEDTRQHLRMDADAFITNAHDRIGPFLRK